jgi:hypothetical protein
MSGSGDIGGEVSGDEAAWRDLIARFDTPADATIEATPWPAREDLPDSDRARTDPTEGSTDPGAAGPGAAGPAPVGQFPADRARVIRFAGDPRSYTPAEEEDEPYVPTALPPPARMDSLSKGAWLALIAGPAYLLIGTLLSWSISGTEALIAIGAFIAGFVILVLKMGDRPPRDSDDDGAVL